MDQSNSLLHCRNTTSSQTRKRALLAQIWSATWAGILSVIVAVTGIVIICLYTAGKPTTDFLPKHVAPFISAGLVILKGGLTTLIGVSLYQRLWIVLAGDAGSNGGITISEVESRHRSSRLVASMLAKPSKSPEWAVALFCFAVLSFLGPVLQSAVDVVVSTQVTRTELQLYHAQLDHRMAMTATAGNMPNDAKTFIRRTALTAVFGETLSHQYTTENVTGAAATADIEFVDVDCIITTQPAKDLATDDNYYNFTSEYDSDRGNPSRSNIYNRMFVNATLFNSTHFLFHSCKVAAAKGYCETRLSAGSGIMGRFTCHRSSWIDPLPDDVQGPAAGFYAVTMAFVDIFQGAAWRTFNTVRPQQNSTFVEATAMFEDRWNYTMPKDLLSHFQRVLWHIPVDARPRTVPDKEKNGEYDLEGTVNFTVHDEAPVPIVEVSWPTVALCLAFACTMGTVSLVYVSVAKCEALGRLTQDSLVHSLTVGGPNGEAIAAADTDSLNKIIDDLKDRKLRYSAGGGGTRRKRMYLEPPLIDSVEMTNGGLTTVQQGGPSNV